MLESQRSKTGRLWNLRLLSVTAWMAVQVSLSDGDVPGGYVSGILGCSHMVRKSGRGAVLSGNPLHADHIFCHSAGGCLGDREV